MENKLYALNLADDGRILSANSIVKYAPESQPRVSELPEGNLPDYKYINGEYVYDPLPKEEPKVVPTQLDMIEAQVTYTAMMTDTLLEV